MYRKPWLTIMLMLLIVALIAAQCTVQIPAQTPASETAAMPETEAAEAGPEEPEKVKITWLTLDWPTEGPVAAFETENPDIEVEVEAVGFNELFEQIQIRLAAGSETPDVISVDVPLVASYGLRGWLLPLDDLFTGEEKADWVEASLEAGKYDGKLLAAPISTSTQLLFYNRNLLEQAGITPPGPDERLTWEQVADMAQQLNIDENADGTPEVWGFIWEQMIRIYQLQPMPMSLGAPAIGPDGLTVRGVVDSEEWVEAFTFYWKAFNEWQFAPQGDVFWPPDIFETGNLAMFVGGPWNIRRFAEADLDFEWGVSRHPYFEGGEIVTPTGSWHIGVNANSQNQEAAMRFVHWISTGKGAEIWWRQGSGDFPAQKSVLELFKTDAEFDELPLLYMRTAADEATVNPQPRPVTPGYLEYEQILQDVFQDIRNGADPREALQTGVDRIEREMQKYQQ